MRISVAPIPTQVGLRINQLTTNFGEAASMSLKPSKGATTLPDWAARTDMDIRIFAEPQLGASYDEQLAVAKAVERLGFGGYFRADHLMREGSFTRQAGPTDVWMTLAGLARETSRIRLGSLMSCSTFRNPAHLAIIAAQADAMSDGRIELGLGAGSFPGEHDALGFPSPSMRDRFDGAEEQLELITGLWTAPLGELYTYEGKQYRVHDYPALVRPVQTPYPPIIIGGHGLKRTPALAARYANEYNIDGVGPAACTQAYNRVRQACERIDRDPAGITFSAVVAVCCAQDSADLARRIRVINTAVSDWKDPAQTISEGVFGRPQEVVNQLRAFRHAGAERVYLQLFDLTDLDQLELIAQEVLPHLP
jgi:alkanesulfonate monooxygenase SsuD/methylene tetrahydromethanopterin reductase-like flavin-dependent oxidoreductase (luciferase family)